MNLKSKAVLAITTLTAATMALVGSSAASAAVYWPTAADSLTKTTFAVDSQESFTSTQGFSTLFNAKDQLCETLGESPCANVTTDVFNGSYVLPVCTSATQILCLDTVNIYKGTKAAATFIRQVVAPTAKVDAATATAGIPAGGATSLYTGADGKTYAVSVEVQVQIVKGKLTANTFSAVVNPYTVTTGAFAGATVIKKDGKTFIDDQRELNCAWVENGTCGELQDFDPATRVGITFRMGKPTAQFLSGRLVKPTLAVAKAAGTNQISLSIDAAPASVQQLAIKLATNKVPAGLNVGGAPKGMFDYSLDTTKNVTALRTAAGNKASGNRTFWAVTNQDDSRITQPTSCKAASGIAGLVATDALVADSFSPVKNGGALKQTINGMLNNADGKADSGSLDLLLADDFARCTFGLAKTGTLKVKTTGGTAANAVTSSWVSASLSGIKYGSASTPTVVVTR
ncbi:MAG: hypothetical protein RL036_614 [Actinomycetota bacterium]|jgi:hypothetical protein